MSGELTSAPCQNCGKINRPDFDGLCALCAWKAGEISQETFERADDRK